MVDPRTKVFIPDEIDPAEWLPTHDEAGVDLTLIRCFLEMTPAQRLDSLQNSAREILELRMRMPNVRPTP